MKSHYRKTREQGSSLIELTLILPLLWLFLTSSCELYKALQVHQVLSVISREIGNSVIRSCNTFDPAVSPPKATDIADSEKCVKESVNHIVNSATPSSSPVRQAKIIVRLIRPSGAGTSPVPVIEVAHDPASYNQFESKYTPEVVQTLNSFKSGKKDLLVTTEVFLELPRLAPCFEGKYYETTIF